MIRVEIGSGLRDLASVIQPEFAYAEDLIASLLRDAWKTKALEVRAYRTGAYYQSITRDANALTTGDSRVRDVLSDVGYADIIERGRRDANYPGRFPAQLAIEAASPDIETILGAAAERAIDRIEHG